MKKILLLLMIAATFVGCGKTKKEDISKYEEEKKTEQTQSSDLKIEDSQDDKRIDIKSGGNELGLTEGLPDNYPKDVPQPPNSKCMGSLNSSEGTVVTFESKDNVKQIIDYFKSEMKKNGYSAGEGTEAIISDQGGIIAWKKGEKEISLMLGYDKEKSISSVIVTYK